MALTHYKDRDDFDIISWRHNWDLLPYYRRSAWCNDTASDWPRRWDWDIERRLLNDVVSTNKEGYQVSIDVEPYRPYQLSVRTHYNEVIIKGKHEERHYGKGYVAREFTRRYILPSGYDPKKVTAELTSDGFLTIKAPWSALPQNLDNKERYVIVKHV